MDLDKQFNVGLLASKIGAEKQLCLRNMWSKNYDHEQRSIILKKKIRIECLNCDRWSAEAFSHNCRTASLGPTKKVSGVAGPKLVRHIHCWTICGISGWTVASGPRASFRGKLRSIQHVCKDKTNTVA